jgi:hypothetical protein
MPIIKIIPLPGPQGPAGPGNFDGGRAGSVYTTTQQIDGGNASGQQHHGMVGG